jgi:uncharacterized protein YqgV (UPF0045/DUF77 family)
MDPLERIIATVDHNSERVQQHLLEYIRIIVGEHQRFQTGVLGTLIEQAKKEIIMALSTAEQALIATFNAETNRIAALIEQLSQNPPEDDAEFNAALQTIADQLKAVGANPEEPVPPAPPVE